MNPGTWLLLTTAQAREQPVRLAITVLAIALGVALGASVFLVNATALNEFGLATRRLTGDADLIVRAPHEGFSEALFVQLAKDPSVAAASPVLEVEAAVPGEREPLEILGLDPFRAAALQSALLGDVPVGILDLFDAHAILLSAAAGRELHLQRGASLRVTVGSSSITLRVIGILPEAAYPQSLGLMDIASAQWTFDAIGRLNRIDLRLAPGTSVDAFRSRLERRLPPGALAVTPRIEHERANTVTRAYRINLNMLALVALWTGAFLVFSTQSLSVLRRRRSLALLRALGLRRAELERALIAEGLALGAVGSLLGIFLGVTFAAAVLHILSGDLGQGQMFATSAPVHAPVLPMICFFCVGTLVAGVGAFMPARSAARQSPARALKGGDADFADLARTAWQLGAALLLIGSALARLPAVRGLPIFGYAAVAALLFGAVLLVPTVTIKILRLAPRANRVVWDASIAQLRENVGLSTLSLASIIVSFSLMVAMAIMVYSFRVSFEHWLGKLLPADLNLREPVASDTAYWPASLQQKLAAVPGVGRIEFRRSRQILLDAGRPPVTLIARGVDARETAEELPLQQRAVTRTPAGLEPAWISESLHDLYGISLGDTIAVPLGRQSRTFQVAGIWRDYARAFGAIVIPRPSYIAATGDRSATEASVWLDGRVAPAAVEAAIRACFAPGDAVQIMTSTAIRERSLQIFDRSFAITYALEAIAVAIGLTGISFAASSTALARRAEFGMLRHIGMLRRQVLAMLASEGVVMSAFGVLYGLVLGAALSLVLVYVVNRQSFNWSIDLAVPAWQLAVLSATLIIAAALTALSSGRAATSQEAVQAVREDW